MADKQVYGALGIDLSFKRNFKIIGTLTHLHIKLARL